MAKNRVLAKCMSWLISFESTSSICEERKASVKCYRNILVYSWIGTHNLPNISGADPGFWITGGGGAIRDFEQNISCNI